MARVNRTQLRNEIRLGLNGDNEVKVRTKRVAQQVQRHWRDVAWPASAVEGRHGGLHPYDTGAYRESIKIRRNRGGLGRFIAGWQIYSDSPNAVFIEFGTGPDKPGSRSPWGPFTPTPEFAPAGKTELYFKLREGDTR